MAAPAPWSVLNACIEGSGDFTYLYHHYPVENGVNSSEWSIICVKLLHLIWCPLDLGIATCIRCLAHVKKIKPI